MAKDCWVFYPQENRGEWVDCDEYDCEECPDCGFIWDCECEKCEECICDNLPDGDFLQPSGSFTLPSFDDFE